MMIEVFSPWERGFGYSPWACLSLLKRANYRILFVCPNGLVPHEPTETNPFPEAYAQGYNVICYHSDLHVDHVAGAWCRSSPAGRPQSWA